MGEDEGEHEVWWTQLQMTPDLSHGNDSCLNDCVHWSMPSQPSAHSLPLPKLIPWCPGKPYRQQRRDRLNVATFCPSKIQVYKNQKMEKWDSQPIWQQGSFLLACSGLTSLQKDILGRLHGALHILFPWQVPKSISTILQTTCWNPTPAEKNFSISKLCDLPESVSPERLYSDCKCCKLFL